MWPHAWAKRGDRGRRTSGKWGEKVRGRSRKAEKHEHAETLRGREREMDRYREAYEMGRHKITLWFVV